MPFNLVTGRFCLVILAAFTSLSASAFAGNRLTINVDRDEQSGDMNVRVFYDGCISSSARLLGEDITVTLDEKTAAIRLDGDFHLDKTPRIQTADCMGRLQREFTFEGTAARRYRLYNNDKYAGVKDFNPTIAEESATCPSRFNVKGRASPSFSRDRYCHWRVLATDASAPDLLSLISMIAGSHPESDGNPQSTLTMSITPSADTGVNVAMDLIGIEDDSVAGQRYRGIAVMGESGWRFTELVTQHLCARGDSAGQWVKEGCA